MTTSSLDDRRRRYFRLVRSLRQGRAERAEYEALRLDLADAVGVALADKYRTNSIFTLDQRDFRAIEPLTPGMRSFRILPADL